MIRVTIDLVPFGNEDKKEQIGEMLIGNKGKFEEGNLDNTYVYEYSGWQKTFGKQKRISGKVLHCRDYPVFDLIEKVLSNTSTYRDWFWWL